MKNEYTDLYELLGDLFAAELRASYDDDEGPSPSDTGEWMGEVAEEVLMLKGSAFTVLVEPDILFAGGEGFKPVEGGSDIHTREFAVQFGCELGRVTIAAVL